MGLCFSKRKKFDNTPQPPTPQDGLFTKENADFKKDSDYEKELLQKLYQNRRTHLLKDHDHACIIKKQLTKTLQMSKTSKLQPLSLKTINSERIERKTSKEMCDLFHSFSSINRNQTSANFKDVRKIKPITKQKPSLNASSLQTLKLPWESSSDMAFVEEPFNEFLEDEIDIFQSPKSWKNSCENAKQKFTSRKHQFFTNNDDISYILGEPYSKLNDICLKIPHLQSFQKYYTVITNNQSNMYEITNTKNGVCVSTLYYKKAPVLNSFFNKLSTKVSAKTKLLEQATKKEIISKDIACGDSVIKVSSLDDFFKTDTVELSYRTQNEYVLPSKSNSIDFKTVPYRSSSLTIIRSLPLFQTTYMSAVSNKTSSSNFELPQRKMANTAVQTVPSANQQRGIKQSNVKFSLKATQTDFAPRYVTTKRSIDPTRKMIRILQKYYRREFKTLEDLLQMPPKDLILFLTSGEFTKPLFLSHSNKRTRINHRRLSEFVRSGV